MAKAIAVLFAASSELRALSFFFAVDRGLIADCNSRILGSGVINIFVKPSFTSGYLY